MLHAILVIIDDIALILELIGIILEEMIQDEIVSFSRITSISLR